MTPLVAIILAAYLLVGYGGIAVLLVSAGAIAGGIARADQPDRRTRER